MGAKAGSIIGIYVPSTNNIVAGITGLGVANSGQYSAVCGSCSHSTRIFFVSLSIGVCSASGNIQSTEITPCLHNSSIIVKADVLISEIRFHYSISIICWHFQTL